MTILHLTASSWKALLSKYLSLQPMAVDTERRFKSRQQPVYAVCGRDLFTRLRS